MTEIDFSDLLLEFTSSQDTLRVYSLGECIYKSEKDVLIPLIEYISQHKRPQTDITILDKITGNAAALLAIQAGATLVVSPLGSQLAAGTLDDYRIKHHITRIVPFILARNGKDMCPMEKLSLGKSPQHFYQEMCQRLHHQSSAK